ncbi:MAG: hypothetical protein KJ558_09355 [Gammaproteobacteria bacterium]|nr:hypothetical protein [Gammaproteobacteria bacterium]MBU1655012.1 hypothetical protein [Gammaproteobacteria bacterium]MBU1960033.1 hypothetical protein [Gammaproteobacteria bacterium]
MKSMSTANDITTATKVRIPESDPYYAYDGEVYRGLKYPNVKSWRKWVKGVDSSKRGGFALLGEFLIPGAEYLLPAGAVIIVVDGCWDEYERRPWRWGSGETSLYVVSRVAR